MAEFNQRIAIFGGSFDPVHNGHLKTAKQVQTLFDLNTVNFMPCKVSPHKLTTAATAEQRLDMLALACKDYCGFETDARELIRDGTSYSHTSISEYNQENPHSQLLFLMGMDSLLTFTRWYKWQEILDLCHIVVSARPGYQLDKSHHNMIEIAASITTDKHHLETAKAGFIYLMENEEFDISSTSLRSQHNHASKKIPKSISNYIRLNNLYRK